MPTDTVTAVLTLIQSTQDTRKLVHRSNRRSVRLTDGANQRTLTLTSATSSPERTMTSINKVFMLDAQSEVTVTFRALQTDTPQVVVTKLWLMYGALYDVVISTTNADGIEVALYWS